MATKLPKTKKEFIALLKEAKVGMVGGKRLSKATLPQLKEKYIELNPEMEKEFKQAASKKEEAKKQPEKVEEIKSLSTAELLQLAAEAKKQGEANKEQIVSKTARKSKWSAHIVSLINAVDKKDGDGVYSFALQDVLDLTGLKDKNAKGGLSAWISYGGDWKPTYKGVGKAVLLHGYIATVKGSPGASKSKQAAFDPSGWSLVLTPVTAEKQIELMKPRLKGVIKNWIYTQEELSDIESKLTSDINYIGSVDKDGKVEVAAK